MALKIRFGQVQAAATSSKSSKEGYLPGGTATIAQGKITGRIKSRGMDEMGRYLWMNLQGEGGYDNNSVQSMQSKAKNEPFTAHMQQVKALLNQGC